MAPKHKLLIKEQRLQSQVQLVWDAVHRLTPSSEHVEVGRIASLVGSGNAFLLY